MMLDSTGENAQVSASNVQRFVKMGRPAPRGVDKLPTPINHPCHDP